VLWFFCMYSSLSTPKELKTALPLASDATKRIALWKEQLVRILQGKDPRVILIVGPCSIHHPPYALEYAKKLRALSLEVSDVFMVIMRAYLEKSRTSFGWKGLAYDPYVDKSFDMQTGLFLSRQFLLDLANLRIPAATEFLDPLLSLYIEDCITWGSIGARTTQSQIHRHLASALSMPIGYKNRPDGDLENTIYSLQVAKEAHVFPSVDMDGKICMLQSKGNCLPHLVLRGGKLRTNYDEASIKEAMLLLQAAFLEPSIIVDCAHDNCQKDHRNIPTVFEHVVGLIATGGLPIRGMMVESYLQEGRTESLCPQTSITDPCIDWQMTERLVLQAAQMLRTKKELQELCTL
jgi:3-deoxy-7-phosphoheptulonate synthase